METGGFSEGLSLNDECGKAKVGRKGYVYLMLEKSWTFMTETQLWMILDDFFSAVPTRVLDWIRIIFQLGQFCPQL